MALPPQISVKTSGSLNLLQWIWKHKFWILFFISTIPSIIYSIHIAQSTGNWSYIPLHLALSITSADSELYNYTTILENNPSQLIGIQQSGIWGSVVYAWNILGVVWLLLGTFFLIFVPLFAIHRIIRWRNTSEEWGAWIKSILWFALYLFVSNLIFIVVGLIGGTIQTNFNPDWDIYRTSLQVVYLNLPLHGVIELGKYIVSLLV